MDGELGGIHKETVQTARLSQIIIIMIIILKTTSARTLRKTIVPIVKRSIRRRALQHQMEADPTCFHY